MTICNHEMTVLEGDAMLINEQPWDNHTLYRDLQRPAQRQKVRIRLVPYYAWDNRGIDDMSVWISLVCEHN